jgi:hypothetical protein
LQLNVSKIINNSVTAKHETSNEDAMILEKWDNKLQAPIVKESANIKSKILQERENTRNDIF